MKASELITKLVKMVEKHGDINVGLSHDHDAVNVWFYKYQDLGIEEIMITYWGENESE